MTKVSALWRCQLYKESIWKSKASKVNMKSIMCQEFPSPELLERPKDGKIKENATFFSFQSLQTRFTTLAHITNDHGVHIIYNQWISSHFSWKCSKKILDSAEKRMKSCAKKKGLAKAITHHSLTELNIIIFHDCISYCHYNH